MIGDSVSDSQFEVLIAKRPTHIGGAKYGQNQSFNLAKSNILLLPNYMRDASDPENIHYSQVNRWVDDFAFARGLLSEASAFIHLWPQTQSRMNATLREWANTKISSSLLIPAVPEFLAVANILHLDTSEDRSTKQDVYQRWWGLQTSALYTDEYEAIGKLPTTPYRDEYDPYSGYGLGHQFYPSVTQSMLAGERDLLKVQMVGEKKKGRITAVYGVDEQKVRQPYQSPYKVDVTWDDGSSERLSYFAVRQLDPILEKPLICRAQVLMSPYDADGKPKAGDEAKNSFVQQLASVLVIAALDSGQYPTLLPRQIVRVWANISHDFLVPAGINRQYHTMTSSESGLTLTGWQTTEGQQVMENIYLALLDGVIQIARLGPLIGVFLDNYDVILRGTVYDSGLVVCPHCRNCESLSTAECVDFGIQTGDSDEFFSIEWQTQNMGRGEAVRCVATVKCAECNILYYRKFKTLIHAFDNILSVSKVGANRDPDLEIDTSARGGGCQIAPITAYSFIPRSETGTRRITSLPRLRLFGQYDGRIRAADIALEVGTQSRNLNRINFCTGKYPVAGGSMTSHAYFDLYIGKDGLRGTGDFAMSNRDDWKSSRMTGALVCAWCEDVGVQLNEPVATTLEAGTYYTGRTDFMEIQSQSGSTKFDKRDMEDGKGGDYITDADGKFQHYRLRLIKGGKTRILEVGLNELGQKIPNLNESPSTEVKFSITPPCPNEYRFFLGPTLEFFEKYLKAEQKHENQESRFIVCEQLAYSARKNPTTHSWEAVQPSSTLREDTSHRRQLFERTGIDAASVVWKKGNRKCVTPKGERERFPDPRLGMNTAATIITPYTNNQTRLTIPQYHAFYEVGQDTINSVDPASGATVTTITPFFHCSQCEDSYHGAPSEEAALKWRLPDSVGSEFLRPGETQRRNDKQGGYSKDSVWHWILPLYTENKLYETWIEGLSAKNPETLRQIFPSKMRNWIMAGQTFTAKDSGPSRLALNSGYPPECVIVTSDDKTSSGSDEWYIGLLPSNLSTIESSKATISNFDGNYSTPIGSGGEKTTSVQEYVEQHSPFHPTAFDIGYEVRILKERD